jgi:predicted O-methyltransferase YrrM
MTPNPVPDAIEAFAADLGPSPDAVLREMEARAEREEFPTIGPAIGGWFQLLAALVDAERVFEFGSGFGYSAYWFARALPADGEVVLTEIDADELDDARAYLSRGGLAARARFEHGDAIETVERYDGPFDVVLIDIEKARYVEAFEAVRGKLSAGSVVLADNLLSAGSHVEFDGVRDLLATGGEARREEDETDLAERGEDEERGGHGSDYGDGTRGVASYLNHVRDAEGFETALLPLGEGVAVTRRR